MGLDLSAEFGEDYEGDDDGYAWLAHWREHVRPELIRAVFAALRQDAAFDVVSAPRGASPEEEVNIAVTWKRPGARMQA